MSTVTLPVPDLDFQDERHVYFHRGYQIPSVTQVMEPMSLMLYAGVPSDVLADAAGRGTAVHLQISNYIKFGVEETDEETEPYFNAYRKFAEDFQPVWLESEYRTHHKLMNYAGTLDLVGFVTPDDGNGVDVVDIKTTAQYHGVMLTTQVSAYAEALKSWDVPVRNSSGSKVTRPCARFRKSNRFGR